MPLAYMRRRIKNTIITGIYRCSRYNNNGGSACSQHYIAEEHISTFVLEDIRRFAHLAVTEGEELAQQLDERLYCVAEFVGKENTGIKE